MISLLQANSTHLPLADKSVQMCVTSPPFYRLRDYNIPGQLGLEDTPEEYVAALVAVFREVWRALRNDGTVWLNLGDSYAGGSGCHPGGSDKQNSNVGATNTFIRAKNISSAKPKDLIGIPWMTAFALRADGWYLRSDIIWAKPNPMPESVEDRPSKSYEHLFLLSKSSKYYYDNYAILEPAAYDGRKDTQFKGSEKYKDSGQTFAADGHERWPKRLYPEGNNQSLHDYKHSGYFKEDGTPLFVMKNGIPMRNKRDVWTITTAPFKDAHFATYPPALVEPCVRAGTSERGCCPRCGAAWERIVEPDGARASQLGKGWTDHKHDLEQGMSQVGKPRPLGGYITTGWQPTCTCDAGEPVPCKVLDPFSGAFTTGVVCQKLERNCVGIDLSWEYLLMSRRRLMQTALADWGSHGKQAGGGLGGLPMFEREEECIV